MTQITLFGRPEIRHDGVPVTDFLSNKVRAVLYRLAASAELLARSQLAALCWGDLSEQSAAKNLRQALYDIQQKIALDVTRQTVGLSAGVDVRDFDAALARKDYARAVELYRGPLLDDFAVEQASDFMAWLTAERARLHADMVQALRHLLAQQQQPADLRARWLQQWVAIDPTAEAEQRSLIEQLAQTGDFTAALAQYDRLRDALAQTVGIAPTAATERLIAKIEQARKRTARPTRALPPLIGREAELQQVQTWLAERQRLITICGMGGAGKTRLAQAVFANANALANVRLVALADADTLTAALTEIADAFGLPPQPPQRLAQQLSGLLILDNCEQIISAEFIDWVIAALADSPTLQLLLTSRERLHLQGERVLLLTGLREQAAAIDLFIQSAQRVKPDFEPDRDDLRAIAHIADRVAGLPLALEIAGSLVKQFDCATLAIRIADAATLQGQQLDLPARQRSMRAVFDYSWRLLDPAERQLFSSLSIFAGGFDLKAAQQVTQAQPAALRNLIHKSLLHFDPVTGRYMIHDLLRQYAREKLDQGYIQ